MAQPKVSPGAPKKKIGGLCRFCYCPKTKTRTHSYGSERSYIDQRSTYVAGSFLGSASLTNGGVPAELQTVVDRSQARVADLLEAQENLLRQRSLIFREHPQPRDGRGGPVGP